MKLTWERVATFDIAAHHGFRKSGLFPFTIKGIDETKFGPARMEKKKREKAKENSTQDDDTDVGACGSSRPISADDTTQNVTYESPEPSTSFIELPDNVASSFSKLNVPEPIQKKKRAQSIRDKLLEAISGSEAIQMLREKEERKKAEEAAKLKRKEERALQKARREKEKILKNEDRERKRKERESKQIEHKIRANEQGGKRAVEEGSESDDPKASMTLASSDSSDIEKEFEMCPACNKGDRHPLQWEKCLDCATR